jgi:heme/copper-type cytochrome/quinol oxidase subunit 2
MVRALVLIPVLVLVLVGLFFVLRPDSPAPSSAVSESNAEGSREKTFDLAIEEGVMIPDRLTVDEGERVKFQITSDSSLELHLHGYDLSREIEPGEPVRLSFEATITGRFEIEDEQRGEELGVLTVLPR